MTEPGAKPGILAHNHYTELPLHGPGHVPVYEQSLAEGYLPGRVRGLSEMAVSPSV